MVGAARRTGPCVSRGDSRDVRAVEACVAVDGEPARRSRIRTGEDACDDHFRRRPFESTPWEASGIGVTARGEEGIRRIDAVVDDPDLDPRARGAGRRVQLVRPDHRRAAVRLERVRQARIDLLRESEARQRRKFRHRQIDRESIQHDLKALLYTCLRDRAAEIRNGTLLL